VASAALVLVLVLAAGCGGDGTPEDEIRALVNEAEAAAEERDAAALRDLVADDYRDPEGRDADDIRTYLHGYIALHPSLNLITRIDSIKLEGTEQARIAVTVGMLGRTAGDDAGWDLAGDVYRLDLRLAREDGGAWRLVRAGPRDGG
jgi:hypothetical protein